MSEWPPRLTITPEAAIRVILLSYETEKDQEKTVMALLRLVNEAYLQGQRATSGEGTAL
jgi:hypothetical protein